MNLQRRKMAKKAKKAGKYNRETNKQIDESRMQLAIMLANAAVSWKTGASFAELMGTAVSKNMKADNFWLDLADTVSVAVKMVEDMGDSELREGEKPC